VNPHLFVTVEDSNAVRLYGIVNSSEEKEAVEKSVKGIKDTKKIANDLVSSQAQWVPKEIDGGKSTRAVSILPISNI